MSSEFRVPSAGFVRLSEREISERWVEDWGGFVVTPYREFHPGDVEGARLVGPGGETLAVVTWSALEAEIVTLDAMVEGRGYGTAAMEHAEAIFRAAGLHRCRLHTTNPNIRAISLYLRRGYRVVKVHLDAMDRVRERKPGVPLEEHGLPLRDMWEMVKEL